MSDSNIRSGNRDSAERTLTRVRSVIHLAAFAGYAKKVGAMVAPGDIQHLIVLMLENRSFDCMLGRLYPPSANFAGLTGNETNPFARPDGDEDLPVWSGTGMAQQIACTPKPDPGELFDDMNTQLFGSKDGRQSTPPSMRGFIANYMAQKATDEPHDPASVMHYFTPEQVPVISRLARSFGVCDQWHAPAPCQTWPNRFFAHTATALGHVNNGNFPIPFPAPSIFKRLEDCGKSWRIYFHDAPQSILLRDIWTLAPLHFRPFSQFLADAHTGALPNYSFIEPRYFADFGLGIPNDQHPPHNVAYGEQLVAAVYNAVRGSPCWKKSLLVVTYDEHGGCYDHMPPPGAVAPDNCDQEGFAFDAYGVRVPAIVISPHIPRVASFGALPRGSRASGHPTHSITRQSSLHFACYLISASRLQRAIESLRTCLHH